MRPVALPSGMKRRHADNVFTVKLVMVLFTMCIYVIKFVLDLQRLKLTRMLEDAVGFQIILKG